MKITILLVGVASLLSTGKIQGKEVLPRIDPDRFHDVLLVVNYNHPYYESIPFIRSLYSPLFPNIVFYGEKEAPDVQVAEIYFGVYLTRVITDVLLRFPNYRGYLFLQDDCMLNVWNLGRLDKDKIWLAVSKFPNYEELVPESWKPDFDKSKSHEGFLHASIDGFYREHWGWWVPHVYGLAAVQKVIPHLNTTYLRQLERNVGKNVVIALPCDMFYIPNRLRNSAIELSQIFKDVFYEISVPMMCSCMESMEQWEILKMFWGVHQNHFLDYRTDVDWIHPLKFSKPEHQEFVQKLLYSYYETLR